MHCPSSAGRPPTPSRLRRATSPPIDGVEERRQAFCRQCQSSKAPFLSLRRGERWRCEAATDWGNHVAIKPRPDQLPVRSVPCMGVISGASVLGRLRRCRAGRRSRDRCRVRFGRFSRTFVLDPGPGCVVENHVATGEVAFAGNSQARRLADIEGLAVGQTGRCRQRWGRRGKRQSKAERPEKKSDRHSTPTAIRIKDGICGDIWVSRRLRPAAG